MPDDETPSTYKPPVLDLFGEDHVRRYRATDGEVGTAVRHPLPGLTTTGRKPGESRTRP